MLASFSFPPLNEILGMVWWSAVSRLSVNITAIAHYAFMLLLFWIVEVVPEN
jgi:hypothetical protein